MKYMKEILDKNNHHDNNNKKLGRAGRAEGGRLGGRKGQVCFLGIYLYDYHFFI